MVRSSDFIRNATGNYWKSAQGKDTMCPKWHVQEVMVASRQGQWRRGEEWTCDYPGGVTDRIQPQIRGGM